MVVFIKGGTDFSHSAVHHVGGGNHVCSGLGMGEGGLGQDLKGGVVVHRVADQAAAVAVVGVFTEADIGGHHDFRGLVLQLLDGPLDNAVLGMGAGADSVLFFGDAKENHGLYTQLQALFRLFFELINREAEDAGH